MHVHHFFDPATYTLTYLVFNDAGDAVVIDPVLDYDPLAAATSTRSNDAVVEAVKDQKLRVHAILETHAHADHLSGSQDLRRRLEAPVAIGSKITTVQETFKGVFNLPDAFKTDGSQFDLLLEPGSVFNAGALEIEVIPTPGHTPACVSYRIGDAVFTGDAMFMPDSGTGRCDFPAGSATDLYHSIMTLYALPDDTRVFVGHDYQPNGRELAFETTIGAAKENNIQLRSDTTLEEFIAFRTARDATLAPPRLIFQSVQVNVDAGNLPAPESNERRYLKIPLNLFG